MDTWLLNLSLLHKLSASLITNCIYVPCGLRAEASMSTGCSYTGIQAYIDTPVHQHIDTRKNSG